MSATVRKINWAVLALEGVAIVVSILLAFAIDAWWKERSDRKLLDNALVGLRVELQSNIEMIDQFTQRHQNIVDAGVILLETKHERVPIEELGLVFPSGWMTDYSTGALGIVLGSTRLDLLEDEALRTALVALPARYEDALEDERWAIERINETWVPYISSVLPMASLWDVALPNDAFPVSQAVSDADFSRVAASLEFRNHVTNRIGYELLSITAQRELRATLEAMVTRIEAVGK